MQSKLAELLHQYFELGVAEGREGRNYDTEAGDAQRVLSEIEVEIAALSTDAEPVAQADYKALFEECQLARDEIGFLGSVPDCIRYLDAEAKTATLPAPSVAVKVKSLEWEEDGKYLRARMGDREYMLNITSDGKTWAGFTRPFVFGYNGTWSSVPNCSFLPLENAKATCQADCQSRYAALSAQVQDVAGWQDISTAPMGTPDDAGTYFIGARQDGYRVNVHTCYRDEHGAYEFWGGGMRPTHWMPFPAAAPVAKQGEAE